MLVHAQEKSVWETCLCVALLRAEVKEPSHRVASNQGRQECGIERGMCGSIVREGCREAELHGGCGMLAVEAIEGCCCRWLFVVQPAQPTQLANTAERYYVQLDLYRVIRAVLKPSNLLTAYPTCAYRLTAGYYAKFA
jgi:hypothetical protein